MAFSNQVTRNNFSFFSAIDQFLNMVNEEKDESFVTENVRHIIFITYQIVNASFASPLF